MPTKKIAVPPEICQLKVTLLGTSPPIWRRLLGPADMTLAQLHDVLQAAMGWEDGHMHEFSIGQRRFGRPDPEDRLMGMPSVENERTVRLSGILARVGSKAIYTYDFGDTWEHSIVLEKRLSVDPNTTYPICTDGQVQLAGDRELSIRNLDRQANLSRNLRAALSRTADGNYGVCLNCEEEIKPKRLEAVPWTAYCIRCQEAADRHQFAAAETSDYLPANAA